MKSRIDERNQAFDSWAGSHRALLTSLYVLAVLVAVGLYSYLADDEPVGTSVFRALLVTALTAPVVVALAAWRGRRSR